MSALAEAELVSSETFPPAGRGRPGLVYRASASYPEEGRRYRLLAEILTALVARFGPEATGRLEEIGEAWGHYLADSPPPYTAVTDEEAVDRLVSLLAEVGFRPSLEEGRRRRVLMRPCPFLELARRHREVVCPIHLGLMRGALAELGATTTTAAALEPFVRPDLCVAHLASR